MSCNGCRILRKGCNENCILRQSLQGIDTPQAQANATLFVAKFFGRAGLMSFLSSVPQAQRSALFQSLLYEACGRTVNPVNGALGLLWTGNWHVCRSAVETVLGGGVLRPLRELFSSPEFDVDHEITSGLDLGLTAGMPARMIAGKKVNRCSEKTRPASPSDESETMMMESGFQDLEQNCHGHETKLLRLFF